MVWRRKLGIYQGIQHKSDQCSYWASESWGPVGHCQSWFQLEIGSRWFADIGMKSETLTLEMR